MLFQLHYLASTTVYYYTISQNESCGQRKSNQCSQKKASNKDDLKILACKMKKLFP